jgi:hypothetical protein
MSDELKAASSACPPWLMKRISIQARNLLALHRIQGRSVSVDTAQTLLLAMGVLVSKAIFEHAGREAAEIEKRLLEEQLDPEAKKLLGLEIAECRCPATDNVDAKGTCMECGKPFLGFRETDPEKKRRFHVVAEGGELGNAGAADPGPGCHGLQ